MQGIEGGLSIGAGHLQCEGDAHRGTEHTSAKGLVIHPAPPDPHRGQLGGVDAVWHVAPYLAAGNSGAEQHLVGARHDGFGGGSHAVTSTGASASSPSTSGCGAPRTRHRLPPTTNTLPRTTPGNGPGW